MAARRKRAGATGNTTITPWTPPWPATWKPPVTCSVRGSDILCLPREVQDAALLAVNTALDAWFTAWCGAEGEEAKEHASAPVALPGGGQRMVVVTDVPPHLRTFLAIVSKPLSADKIVFLRPVRTVRTVNNARVLALVARCVTFVTPKTGMTTVLNERGEARTLFDHTAPTPWNTSDIHKTAAFSRTYTAQDIIVSPSLAVAARCAPPTFAPPPASRAAALPPPPTLPANAGYAALLSLLTQPKKTHAENARPLWSDAGIALPDGKRLTLRTLARHLHDDTMVAATRAAVDHAVRIARAYGSDADAFFAYLAGFEHLLTIVSRAHS